MKYSIGLVIIALSLSACSKSQKNSDVPNINEDGWRAAHADSRNSDYSPVKGSKQVSLIWQKKFSGTINLGPTTDNNGRVYVTTSAAGCHLYALDAKTGEQIWCTDKVNKYAVASSALIDKNNRLYIADDRAMNAFDRDGNLLWQHAIEGFPLSAQFTHTGNLLFITHIGKVYALESATGNALINGQPLSANVPPDPDFDPRACMQGTADCPCANTLAYDDKSGRFYFTYWEPGTANAALWAMQYNENNGGASVEKLWKTIHFREAALPALIFPLTATGYM
jgi:outer membrane protein assembly factor BamB